MVRTAASLAEALQSARALHDAGELETAEIAYRGIVDAYPKNAEALQALAAFLNRRGDFDAAVDLMEKAVRCRPTDAVLRNHLGSALKDAGRPAEAEKSYRQALKRRPEFADAHTNLGALLHSVGRLTEAEQSLCRALAFEPRHAHAQNQLGMVLGDLGKLEEAAQCFHRALAIHPHFADALHNLGMAQKKLGRLQDAEQSCRRAAALEPRIATIHNGLGDVLKTLGRWEEAEQSYRQALELAPYSAEAHNNLGLTLMGLGRFEEAQQSFREALIFEPAFAIAHSNLGNVLRQLGRLEEAERSCRQALALAPDFGAAHNNLGMTLMEFGRPEEAEQSFRRALAINPKIVTIHSNLALSLNYVPGRAPAEIYAYHREFALSFAQTHGSQAHENVPDRQRRLRIGYVSGDLRDHAAAFFIEPVLAKHDRLEVEVTCYHNSPVSDAITQRLKSHAERWRAVSHLKDDALANLIRADAIDILVDLNGHTANNRLLAFARKPAPVQATWLGYLNTTGLDAMDWRITDARASPEGALDSFHSERLFRLPDSQWCYQPPHPCPGVAPPPSLCAGRCTFGAFSTPAKINGHVIELWSRLLNEVPASRVRIIGSRLTSIPAEYRERFTRLGIDDDRLDLIPSQPFHEYLALHNSVDVMLDTFPYTGGTTTCHALWMGVPVVSLVGDTATSRGGASLLRAIGVPELIAETPDRYVDIAAALAADPQRLAALRAGLRERMRSSPLMDATRFTRNLENAYRSMWRTWCERQTHS